MNGSFDIACGRRDDGETVITTRTVSAPWHLSKPYWDNGVLLVQAVNATAGIFAGDHLAFRVRVNPGASVLLTSPSASRIHTMPDGEASLTQTIEVETGGWLEWMPELFIPQRGCRYRQQTAVHVAAGASLYMVETLAPGRVAHGEVFAFERIAWSTKLSVDTNLVMVEHCPLVPADDEPADLRRVGGPWYYAGASLVHAGELPFTEWQRTIHDWNTPSVHIGATMLEEGVYSFRLLAAGSEALRETLRTLRALLAGSIPRLACPTRKL